MILIQTIVLRRRIFRHTCKSGNQIVCIATEWITNTFALSFDSLWELNARDKRELSRMIGVIIDTIEDITGKHATYIPKTMEIVAK